MNRPLRSPKAGSTLRRARQASGLSLRALARKAGTSHATILAYEKAAKSPTMETFLRLLDACDYAVDFDLRPRIREHAGLARGEELVQVLKLAEQFPASPGKHLKFPLMASME